MFACFTSLLKMEKANTERLHEWHFPTSLKNKYSSRKNISELIQWSQFKAYCMLAFVI